MSNLIIVRSSSPKPRIQIIQEEIMKRDYSDVSKRELAQTIGLWAWEEGYSEDKNFSLFLIIFSCSAIGFVLGLFASTL